ncbi:hypothetical protein GOP47_0003506 [Adiantum capillus-veneris]|uniref:Uncharacterized protein n=1 Tax=Adiantum capillus-veneris TaxID=13818 RepID=A0A9D4VDY2_ADICA|nr:hypothetical protein GOP47_0003506 [Adiantum capillus-veneris]
MRGSSKAQRQQRSYWMLYENPFFTEGHHVPKCIPRLPNAHAPRKSISSLFASEAQCASRHHDFVLAAESCAKPFKAYEAAWMHYFSSSLRLPSAIDKFNSGSLVSARKLAALFWELHGVRRLENPDCVKLSLHAQAQHSRSMAPFKEALCAHSPYDCKLCEPLEETSETMQGVCRTTMASSQKDTLADVLRRVRSVEETQSQNMAALLKLKSDSEDVGTGFQELDLSQQSALKEVSRLLQKFGEHMTITRKREKERLKLAFLRLRQGIEEERNTCRLLKMQNKKLAKDLVNANIVAANACEELERQRKARELLEEVCNELAQEIGEDKAQVEQLKLEQEKYKERFEEELKVMRMMALWQDDRPKKNSPEVCVLPLEGDSKQCFPFHEISSKLETFVGTSTVHGERETWIRNEQRRSISKTQRPRKSRRRLQTRRERKSGNVRSSDAIRIEEPTHGKQSPGTESSEGLNEKHSVSTPLENHDKADMVASMSFSFSKDDMKRGTRRVRVLKGIKESAQDMHAAGIGQEQSFSGVQDGDDHLHCNDCNFDMHTSTGGGMMDSADIKLENIYFEPVNGVIKVTAHDKLSQEVSGSQDSVANTERIAVGISYHRNDACCKTMAKCAQGHIDVKKVDDKAENVAFSTIQALNNANLEGSADSGDRETMKSSSSWIPTSTRSLPLLCFWPPSSDALSVLGGSMNYSDKACSLSPPIVQDEQSGLYAHADAVETGMVKGTANQHSLACIKENSLGAQLVRAIELEKKTKPAKPSLCFSPLW